MNQRLDALLFLALASFWGLSYPLVKVALVYVGPFQLAFLRFVVALPFLAALIPRGMRPLRGLRVNLLVALFGALDVFLMNTLWFMGERYVSPSMTSIIIYTYPILITAFGIIFLHERAGAWRIIGVVLGFIGTAVALSGGVQIYGIAGPLLLICAALSFSTAAIIYKRYLAREDFARVNTYHIIYATAMAAALAMAMGPPIPAAFTLTLIIALLLLSALGTAAAYTIYIYFYSKHDVGKIAPYLFTVPMLSVVFSHLMLGTAVTRVELLGLAPLAAGIYLTSRRM